MKIFWCLNKFKLVGGGRQFYVCLLLTIISRRVGYLAGDRHTRKETLPHPLIFSIYFKKWNWWTTKYSIKWKNYINILNYIYGHIYLLSKLIKLNWMTFIILVSFYLYNISYIVLRCLFCFVIIYNSND